jgi:hypothetical protein
MMMMIIEQEISLVIIPDSMLHLDKQPSDSSVTSYMAKKFNLDIYAVITAPQVSVSHTQHLRKYLYIVITRRHSRMRGKGLQWKRMLLTGEVNTSSTPEGTYQVCPVPVFITRNGQVHKKDT